MFKFSTVKINKWLVALIMIWALPTLANNTPATPCTDGLSDLSFEKILDEYAELAFAAEEIPPDSSASIVTKTALEEKGLQLASLIRPDDMERVKILLLQKIKTIRQMQKGVKQETASQEIDARSDEDQNFKINLSASGRMSEARSFDFGELSPNGETFLSVVKEAKSKFKISVYAVPGGGKIFEKNFKSFESPKLKYLDGGSKVELQYYRWKVYGVGFSIGKFINLRTHEFFDAKSGQTLVKKTYVELDPTANFTSAAVSPSGNRYLMVKGGKIEVFNSKGKTEAKFDITDDSAYEVEFDLTGENLLIAHGNLERTRVVITSKNISTKATNWSVDGQLYLSPDRKYIFQTKRDDQKKERYFLLSSETGKVIRTFPENDLNTSYPILSSDSKMIFMTQRVFSTHRDGIRSYTDSLKGLLYKTNDNSPGVPLELPGGKFSGAQFFDNNENFAAFYNGKLYVWNTTSGGSVIIPQRPRDSRLFGVDKNGNLLGAANTDPDADASYYENLQIWDREK